MGQIASEAELTQQAIDLLEGLEAQELSVLTLGRPRSIDHAIWLSTVISKLSPIVGNLLEYEFAGYLNANGSWPSGAMWVRQDPDFPDLALRKGGSTIAGIEIKAWFPLATEITGRFKETQRTLEGKETRVLVVAWLPEFLLHGGPRIVDTWNDRAIDIARSRDSKYHNPPYYLVVEPQDTSERTRNLQQRNVGGVVFQGTKDELEEARRVVAGWPQDLAFASEEYQALLRDLMGRFTYRNETNFAKMDRIDHASLEQFKARVLATQLHGKSVSEWVAAIRAKDTTVLRDLSRLGHEA